MAAKANPGKREPMLWNLQQANAETGVPYTSLRKLIAEGVLPRVRLGTSRRDWVKPADVRRLIANGTEKAS